jgi:hypothetical protein
MGNMLTRDRDEDMARASQLQMRRQLAAAAEPPQPQGASPSSVIDPVAEAARRARLAALNRQGRASTVLSGTGSQVTPAYSNTVLGA